MSFVRFFLRGILGASDWSFLGFGGDLVVGYFFGEEGVAGRRGDCIFRFLGIVVGIFFEVLLVF